MRIEVWKRDDVLAQVGVAERGRLDLEAARERRLETRARPRRSA
jgi:uncharacterized protein (DUF779 family)